MPGDKEPGENTSNWTSEHTVDSDGSKEENNKADNGKTLDDGFILVNAGNFIMGSPEGENWRIDDEKEHEVSISSFFADAYETTQKEYERIMGENPSSFIGENLPEEKF